MRRPGMSVTQPGIDARRPGTNVRQLEMKVKLGQSPFSCQDGNHCHFTSNWTTNCAWNSSTLVAWKRLEIELVESIEELTE